MKRTLFCILAAACFCAIALTAEADWLQFRGPGGSGIAPDKGVPVTWSADRNVAWKTEMPGAGASSPIVMGNKIFITCYSGYGLDISDPGEQKNLKRHLVCVDRQTGNFLWKRDIDPVLPESAYRGLYITKHGYASSTLACDGKNLYVFFGSAGVFAFDFDGKQLWHASVGKRTHGWGTGTSCILYKDLVIVNASVEDGSLVALDKKTGTEVWKVKGISGSWNTPVLAKVGGGTELAIGTEPGMLGIDPDTGKELWRAETYDWYVCPSLVAHDGVLYGLQHTICAAVKAGGRGDVTNSRVLWKKNFGHVVTSPLYNDGHLYWAANGAAVCVKASDGSEVYKERLKGSDSEFYASPLLAGGKLYYVSRSDGVYVVEASPKFKLVAHNTLDDKSVFNASPAVSNSQLFLRSDRYLYCIGKK